MIGDDTNMNISF